MISAEVVYPTDPATGQRATGTFPVLLTQNPYGTGRSDPTTAGGLLRAARVTSTVASAVRGTGDSGGRSPGSDSGRARTAPNWSTGRARPVRLDGKVGLDGCLVPRRGPVVHGRGPWAATPRSR